MRRAGGIAFPLRSKAPYGMGGRAMHIIPGHEAGKEQNGHTDLCRRPTPKLPAGAPHTVYPNFLNGICLNRSPVAWKMALASAGAMAGNAGSPIPVGGKSDWMKYASTALGLNGMRRMG